MGRHKGFALGALLVVAGLLVASTCTPAFAATTGSESFHGVLVASGKSGTRQVVASVVVLKGVFNGVGKVVERDNLPGDPDSASRDDLVFAAGTLHILNDGVLASFSLNPVSCVFRLTVQQTTTAVGGTGRFSDATGTFAATVRAHGVGQHAPDGTCSQEQAARIEVDRLSGTGTLGL